MPENTPPPPPAPASEPSETKPSAYSGPAPTKDEMNMALLVYVAALFTAFVGPLIIWLIKKDQSPFVDDQGKEVLNWIVTLALAQIVCFLLIFVAIGVFLMPLIWIAHVILTIMGALKAKDGIAYRYPFAIRLLK